MRKTIADIVSEASSVACWVYVQKYVKHKTLNEMLQELPDVSQFILAMDTWFEKLMVIEAIIEADNEMQRIKKTKLVCYTKFREKTEQVGRWNIYETRYFRGQSKNKKWGKTAVFFHNLHSSGSDFYYYYRNTLE